MVDVLSIIALLVSGLICFIFPIILYLRLRKKANMILIPIVLGATGFFVMQIIIRIPIISIIDSSGGFSLVSPFVLYFLLAISAALFETFGRVVTMKLFMKNDQRFSAGFAHGIGHGAVEAIVLVGINYFGLVVYAFMINSGTFQTLIDTGGPIGQSYIEVKKVLLETNFSIFLVGGFERVVTMIIHIGLSVLTVFALKVKQVKYIGFVILIHFLLDFIVVILSHYGVNIYIIELFVVIVAGFMIYIMKKVYNQYKTIQREEGSVTNV